jgi:hypothetical protein
MYITSGESRVATEVEDVQHLRILRRRRTLSRPRVRNVDRGLNLLLVFGILLACPTPGSAQDPQAPRTEGVREHLVVTAPFLTPTNEASGTAWLPQLTPMYGVHRPWRGWDLRVNGVAFAQALYEPRDRHRTGGTSTRQVGSVNWGMFMARRNAGGGRFGLRTMISAEPWTVPGCGSLSFLATGEVCEGETIHDRQQPHDLFMELAVDYDHSLRGAWRWQVYGGPAGEPALGPPGSPHRASAIANPIAPVTHHWLDSTHVAFGLITVGAHNQRWKVETSLFNGRQPDESRVDLDLGAFDSVAARLSFLPTERLALQLSAARLLEVWTDFLLDLRNPRPESLDLRCIRCHLQVMASGPRRWRSARITGMKLCRAACLTSPAPQRSSRAA